ncbi:hypothetical protein SETIT_5G394900v2 [Setaria italica]|uniref:Bifunctional inhibitor/plant lipid transfer protein/seed storage helical domain-containing protein n=2 Tax=Setaria italica TaxID=4555 RepID=A0A368RDU8_SETIT|nr:uncharacterized protein LOC101753298 [Setaria italica]RCV28302.1 hypothetical protein SETIT_5G394900v2 [Setaria italica]
MAPSNKLTLIALLVAFAIVAPSAAVRDGGAAKDAPAPAPSASGEATVHPMGFFDDILDDIIHFRIPDLPLPPILPCPPDFPIKIPFIPCYNETNTLECRSSLAKYMPPCAGFLTDADDSGSASSPPKECCNAIGSFLEDPMALCLCHVVNGDFGKLLKAPMNPKRANSFLQQCGFELSSAQVSRICSGNTTLTIPPMDAPSPPRPPTWRHHGTKGGSP